MKNNPPPSEHTATVRQTPVFNSVVWLIPLVALITGGWLWFQHIRSTGPVVTLYMDNAEGIEPGNTVVKVLNVNVGRVTHVKLRDQGQGVELTAKLNGDVRDMVRADTRFWVVKPRIDQSGITGLNTLVSGAYLAFSPGRSDEKATTFTVTDLPPTTVDGGSGVRLRLTGRGGRLISAGSPVLYGDMVVGQVEQSEFDPKTRRNHYRIYIHSPNDQLLNRDAQFWIHRGINIETGGGGFKIDAPPLPALLSGAIAFNVPYGSQAASVADDTEFMLYDSQAEIDNRPSERALYYVVFFRQSVRGLMAGAPVEYKGINVGTVAEVPYFAHNDSHKLFANGWVPVRIRIEPARMEINADEQSVAAWRTQIEQAAARGLGATLSSSNLLTGGLYVELSDGPQSMLKPMSEYRGDAVLGSRSGGLDELQNQLGALLEKFNKLPLEQTLAELNGSLKSLRATLNSANTLIAQPSTQAIPQELNQTLRELRSTLAGVSPESPLYGEVQQTLKSIDRTLKDAQPTLRTLKQQPNALIFKPSGSDPLPKGVR
ncbi:paraquat-inducible protein B [Neisseria sp. HSC-16F19]|nr:intermembrane transport protein PqiB [Neisseria sp. HSC-16F19]MCP2040189.1 paraquat-inducible protein B [Neisseria sp. HSC-16F19]